MDNSGHILSDNLMCGWLDGGWWMVDGPGLQQAGGQASRYESTVLKQYDMLIRHVPVYESVKSVWGFWGAFWRRDGRLVLRLIWWLYL